MIGVDWTRMYWRYSENMPSEIAISRLVSEAGGCEEQKVLVGRVWGTGGLWYVGRGGGGCLCLEEQRL